MKQALRGKLQELFDAVTDYANNLEESGYQEQSIENTDATRGELLLRLVCERERLLFGLKHTNTREWSCSIDDSTNKLQVMQALFHSSADLLVWLDSHDPSAQEYVILMNIIETESRFLGKISA